MTCDYVAGIGGTAANGNSYSVNLSSYRRRGRIVWVSNYHKNGNEIGSGGREERSFHAAMRSANSWFRAVAPSWKPCWIIYPPQDHFTKGNVSIAGYREGKKYFCHASDYTNQYYDGASSIQLPFPARVLKRYSERTLRIFVRLAAARAQRGEQTIILGHSDLRKLKRLAVLA